ncbi:hypothetical protein U9M48_015460, partial [Paspalum notatum var. saurae]
KKLIRKAKQNRHFTCIAKEIHIAVVIRSAVASPEHDLKEQYTKAEDVNLGRYTPTRYILWRHIAAAEDGRQLSIPLHYRKLRNKDWRMVEERFEKRLSAWKGKLLSVGGRLVLINTNDQHKKKYRLAKWETLCHSKDQGGLGILDIDLQNRSLLSKWLFKLCNEDGIWQQLLRNKYLKNKTLSQVERKPGDSHFWSSLMGVKSQFLNLGSFILKNETQATVAEVLSSSPLNVSFRRSLVGNKLRDWEKYCC